MPIHNYAPPRGRFEIVELESELLENRVGDPTRRQSLLYLPEQLDLKPESRAPLFVGLAAYMGSGLKLSNWQAFGESLVQRLDRLINEEKMGPVALLLPDAFTALGGNQYVDSCALGNWSSYLHRVLIPEVESRIPVGGGPARRAVFGHSSGGYGALVSAMDHPSYWGAVAAHSSDMEWDLVYRPEFPGALDTLRAFDFDPSAFLKALEAKARLGGSDFRALMILAMAASYDPDPNPAVALGVRLPVDHRSALFDSERWAAWLAHDPLRKVEAPAVQEALRGLAGLWLDCGSRDEHALHYGHRRLVSRLESRQIPVNYEEFDGGHSGVAYRLDRSLPWLFERLTKS